MALSPMVALLLGQFPCLRKGNRIPLTWPKIVGMFVSLGGVVCIFIRQMLHPTSGESGSSQALGIFVYFIGVCATAFMACACGGWGWRWGQEATFQPAPVPARPSPSLPVPSDLEAPQERDPLHTRLSGPVRVRRNHEHDPLVPVAAAGKAGARGRA